jgi:hypothetical protein
MKTVLHHLTVRWLVSVALVLVVAVACGSQLSGAAETQNIPPAQAPTSVPPTSVPPPSPTPLPPQSIIIDTPSRLTLVGSPIVITGRTARLPLNGLLNYRFVDRNGQELGVGTFQVNGVSGQAGSFNASLVFNLPQDGGIVRAEIFERGNVAGAVAAFNALDLVVDAQYQTIIIDTPPPGTQVGSPMVLTGRTTRGASNGRLGYRVFDSAGQQLGAGDFPVSGAPGLQRSFNAELFFTLPFNGDTIRAEIFDQSIASSAISLYVAPLPQQITIEQPPPLTLVGSPMVITGRTTRFPFSGDLSYRITDAADAILGAGSFPVAGQPDQPTSFTASLQFQLPKEGGIIGVEIYDQSPNGVVVASSAIDMDVLKQYQGIQIDTPPPGTQVGSPVVLTGRVNWFPSSGQLQYRVLDAAGQQIGQGSVPVGGALGGRGSFMASLTFAEPANGGNIRVEISDQGTSASIDLYVAPPPPPQIFVDTPPPGTQVGSPLVITGRTTHTPASGKLNYNVRNAAGAVIGSGQFDVVRGPGQATSFTASLLFTAPIGGGNINVEVSDLNPANGSTVAVAAIGLYVAPRP